MGFFPIDVSQKVDYIYQAISVVYSSSSFRQKLEKFCLSTKLKQQGHEICTVIITGLFLLS